MKPIDKFEQFKKQLYNQFNFDFIFEVNCTDDNYFKSISTDSSEKSILSPNSNLYLSCKLNVPIEQIKNIEIYLDQEISRCSKNKFGPCSYTQDNGICYYVEDVFNYKTIRIKESFVKRECFDEVLNVLKKYDPKITEDIIFNQYKALLDYYRNNISYTQNDILHHLLIKSYIPPRCNVISELDLTQKELVICTSYVSLDLYKDIIINALNMIK